MMRQELRRVGYWRPPPPRMVPRPYFDSMPSVDSGLPDPHDLVDQGWDEAERRKVIAYLKAGRFVTSYMGYSTCRFCGCNNGDSELTDGVWVWPSGFAHYLEQHGVKPPEEFLECVRANGYDIPSLPEVDIKEFFTEMFGIQGKGKG